VIYFIENPGDGLIKIGWPRDRPEARLKSLQTGCGAVLRLLRTMPGGLDAESLLHSRFAALRVRGEWFSPGADLV
jgi:hypothetical protein